ncbi:MAG: Na+/H+ antiporter subunit E [Chloroflexi bacterium]|nr:Na+/H+ antiporter subunit E [Chloroflexota bacterium]
MRHIGLNVALALFWATLNDNYSLPTLVVGYAVGWVVLSLVHTKGGAVVGLGTRRQMRRLWYGIDYVLHLIWEILLAGWTVTRLVFRWRMGIRPGIIAVPADVKGDGEVTALANSITLTPGTWTLDVPADRRVLWVHALDLQDPEQTKTDIKQRLERFILRASRC